MNPPTTLADTLRPPVVAADGPAAWRRLGRWAAIAFAGGVTILLLWSAAAPLSGAVIAAGFVRTELNRKTVQHQEGGIVREILVREGQKVRAGDPLLVVGDVRTDALLDLQRQMWLAESVRHARLSAELTLARSFELPAGLERLPEAASSLARERALFEARRRTLQEQVASLEAQIEATEAQVRALGTQIASTRNGAALSREELALNQGLQRDGYVQRARILGLERNVSDYDGRLGEQQSEQALAQQRMGDLRLRVAQARNQYQQQAAGELKDSAVRLRELEEQLRPARDLSERQYVRSPVDGEVMSLHVTAVGEVIGPRQPLLEVVPANERLVVEARVAVEDIEHVQRDGPAEVRLTAYEYRKMPMLAGRVAAVSADRVEDPRTGQAGYRVLVEVGASELAAYPGARMQPGMPAEVYVTTAPRTLFDYVVRPLSAFAVRGMREP
jgi:HlyD family type I secretion membrane fusion protein